MVMAFSAPLHAADLRVLAGGAVQPILQSLTPQFEKATGITVELHFGVVGSLQKRVMSGEKADVLLLPVALIDGLDKAAAFRAQSRTALGRVGVGVAVRENARVPDVSTTEAVRAMLLEARTVAFPDPKLTPSGGHLLRVFEQLGIAEAMQPKITFKNAIDGGVNLVRDGQVDIGLFIVTEVLPVKGVKLAGVLPASMQSYAVYVAAIAADTASAEAASRFVKFLADPALQAQWKAAGFDPADAGK